MPQPLQLSPGKRDFLLRKLARLIKEGEVPETPELHRILEIPRRVWQTDEIEDIGSINALVAMLTAFTKKPEGTQVLRPIQAKSLQEAHDIGGLFGPIPVGDGKTLITFLAPVVTEAQRPLLVVPARLRRKTFWEFEELEKHWKTHPALKIVSYEKLSRESGTEFLQECDPDLLMLDEAHRVKNFRAAVTRRIRLWIKEHPDMSVIAMSGTITKRSVLDFAHILRWCLPKGFQPLPLTSSELEAWASAVDVIKPQVNKSMPVRKRTSAGALQMFMNEKEKTQKLAGVRSAVRRRIQETPGVISSTGQDVDASLNIVLTLIQGYNDKTQDHAAGLQEGVKPNGDLITDDDLSAAWRIVRTLTSGFWYKWEPPPPDDWMSRRKAWKKIVREVLSAHIKGLESEALVTKAVVTGEFKRIGQQEYHDWAEVRATSEPNVVPGWVADCMIRAVDKWTKGHTGIIWVSEVALGQRLEEKLGLPYFHEMGLDRDKRPIEAIAPTRCIVASVSANSEGRNLHAWNDNLIISPPPTGTVMEQVLGRVHRPGQESDEVWYEVFIGCSTELKCWYQAMQDARFESTIEAPKKLTYATIDIGFEPPYGSNSLWPRVRMPYEEEAG
jgi:hypothetical protein